MRRRYLVLSAITCIAFAISGCGQQKEVNLQGSHIGVIQTSGYNKDSGITFYDENLNKIHTEKMKYATLGEIFNTPVIQDNKLYTIPQGYAFEKDEEKALELDLSNLNKKEYKIEQLAINGVAADDQYIYTYNTGSEGSYITRCKKEDNAIKDIKISDIYISYLLCHEHIIYAFGTSILADDVKSYIYIYNEELELIDQIDITQCGVSQYKGIVVDGNLFFTNATKADDQAENTMSIYSIANKTIETIELQEEYPLDMISYGDMMIISHYDLVRLEGGGITFYNKNTKEQKYYPLDHGAQQIARYKDYLYILTGEKIYKYKIGEMNLEFQKVIENELFNENNYTSGLFTFES